MQITIKLFALMRKKLAQTPSHLTYQQERLLRKRWRRWCASILRLRLIWPIRAFLYIWISSIQKRL